MPYDRTKTEKAALGEIDHTHYVKLGPIEVPYLAFRRSELKRFEAAMRGEDGFISAEGILDAIYEFANYRLEGTLPREDFDEFVSAEAAMAFFADNRGGQKKPVTPVTETPSQSSSTTGDSSAASSSSASPAS